MALCHWDKDMAIQVKVWDARLSACRLSFIYNPLGLNGRVGIQHKHFALFASASSQLRIGQKKKPPSRSWGAFPWFIYSIGEIRLSAVSLMASLTFGCNSLRILANAGAGQPAPITRVSNFASEYSGANFWHSVSAR